MKRLESMSVPRLLALGGMIAAALVLLVASVLRLLGWSYWGAE